MTSARDGARRPPKSSAAARRSSPWRRLLTWVLMLLFCLAAPLALLAVWGRVTLLNTDAYVIAVRSLAADATVQDALARAATEAAASGSANALATPVARSTPMISDAPLAAPTARAVDATPVVVVTASDTRGARQVETLRAGIRNAFASDEFTDAWAEANRALQQSLTARGAAGPLLLDFSALAPEIQRALVETGAADLARAAPPPDALRIELLGAADADRVRGLLRAVRWSGILLPIVAAALLIGSVWAAPSRLRAVGRAGLGLALATIVLMLVVLIGQSVLAGRTPDPAAEIVAALLDRLLQQPVLWALAMASIGLAVAALVAGAAWSRGRRQTPAI
ncbi:MAG: hypothetical protein IT337_01395 [Thermomicrobiales bacterium]|nr:hypothetical protein [Thermomicrobiales bacterium]